MWEATEPKTMQKGMQISGALTDEAVRNESIKKVEKRGNAGKNKNGRDDNKRTRTGNVFTTTINPVGRGNMGTWSKCTTCNSYHAPGGPCRTCFINYNRPGHLENDCRGMLRNVNPINARNPTVRACYECGSTSHVRPACLRWNRAQGPGENRPNQVASNNGGLGHGNQGNQDRGRAFMLGVDEARQDSNIMTGTFTLNNHFATTLFDFGADYSIVSTTFIPLLGFEPNDLGFKYEIEITSRQLVEIDKVIKGCKLEIKVHAFDIDLIPFGHRSFDVIIGIDWLSKYKAEIIFHEKVVRIPLPDGKVLRVLGERSEEKARFLMGIEFRIELIPRATPVANFPYRLALSELEELSGQLKELQDKGTDIAKITRKWSKPDKHGHEKGKSAKEPEVSSKSETMVFHNEDGNPARANIKQALGYLKDGDGDGNSQPHKGVKASANSDVMYFFTSAQDGDPSQDDVRLCLGDDLKKAQDHSQRQAIAMSKSLEEFSNVSGFVPNLGRIQLIASILASMQMYWALVYLLATTVINDVEKLFKRFLWNAGSAKGKARVSWKVVCKPKDQGGLGIKLLKQWNESYILRHFEDYMKDEEKTLCGAKWVNRVKLKNKEALGIERRTNSDSWGWKPMFVHH
ncbi:putative reverse transcriptase domain-containing protein [Tanacetum coccineum]